MLYKLGQLVLYKLFKATDKEQASMIVIFGLLGVPFSLKEMLMPDAIHLAEVFRGLWLIPIGTLAIRSGMFLIGGMCCFVRQGRLLAK
jgi:hypothetical protein